MSRTVRRVKRLVRRGLDAHSRSRIARPNLWILVDILILSLMLTATALMGAG